MKISLILFHSSVIQSNKNIKKLYNSFPNAPLEIVILSDNDNNFISDTLLQYKLIKIDNYKNPNILSIIEENTTGSIICIINNYKLDINKYINLLTKFMKSSDHNNKIQLLIYKNKKGIIENRIINGEKNSNIEQIIYFRNCYKKIHKINCNNIVEVCNMLKFIVLQ